MCPFCPPSSIKGSLTAILETRTWFPLGLSETERKLVEWLDSSPDRNPMAVWSPQAKKGLISPLFFLPFQSGAVHRAVSHLAVGRHPRYVWGIQMPIVRSNRRYRSYRPPPQCHEQTTVLTKWKRVDINFCLKILAVLIWLLIILAILKTLSQLNLNSHFWFALDPMTVEFVA